MSVRESSASSESSAKASRLLTCPSSSPLRPLWPHRLLRPFSLSSDVAQALLIGRSQNRSKEKKATPTGRDALTSLIPFPQITTSDPLQSGSRPANGVLDGRGDIIKERPRVAGGKDQAHGDGGAADASIRRGGQREHVGPEDVRAKFMVHLHEAANRVQLVVPAP